MSPHRHHHDQDPERSRLPDYLPEHLAAEPVDIAPNEVRLRVNLLGLERSSRMLRDAGARFITMLLAETPEPSLLVAFALRGDLVTLQAPTAGVDPVSYGSLGVDWPAARRAEQELVERHGVRPVGHSAPRLLTRPDPDLLDGTLTGEDVFALPFGPVRSGVFEAIQFLIETGGENVPQLHTRGFFKHRGIEQRFAGMTPDTGVHAAERIAGIASVAHALAYTQAVERAFAIEPPANAAAWRVVHAELERITCHLDVIAKEAETAALAVGNARFQILKEQIMRMRAELCGSRFGRGVIVPGGIRMPPALAPEALQHRLQEFEVTFTRDRRMFLRTASMVDRLIGSGWLPRDLIEAYGAVGPLARGSGLSIDSRHERPYGEYRRLGLRVVTARDGDAMARVQVRFGEIHESLRILRQTLDRLGRRERASELRTQLPDVEEGSAFGWAEAPQGEILTWVEIQRGTLKRVRVASPSLRNWALFEHAFTNDVLTDFAFIEHSFGLTAAGADR